MTGEALLMRTQLARLAARHRRVADDCVLPPHPAPDYDLVVEGLASPCTVDRDFTKFAVDCWTPIGGDIPLLYRHDHNRPAGRILEVEPTDRGLRVRALVTDAEARRCAGFSVGATIHSFRLCDEDDPQAFHALVTSATLSEISLSHQPSNPDALVADRYREPAGVKMYDLAIQGFDKAREIVEVLQTISRQPPRSRPTTPRRAAVPAALPRPEMVRPRSQFSQLVNHLKELQP